MGIVRTHSCRFAFYLQQYVCIMSVWSCERLGSCAMSAWAEFLQAGMKGGHPVISNAD